MDKKIKISPKYGVNPTIPICFWCGKEKNEIALLGRIRKGTDSDMEAPKNAVLDYEPCDACKEQFDQGVQVIECSMSAPDGRMPVSKDEQENPVYPTGRFVILKAEAAEWIFCMDPDTMQPGKKLCMDKAAFTDMFENFIEKEEIQ